MPITCPAPHSNQTQKERLVDAISANLKLYMGKKGVKTGQHKIKAWEKLSKELNELGPARTPEQWQNVLKTIKSKVRQEYKEYKAELKQSKNGITWAEPLSDFQKKVYAICEKPYQSTFKRTTVGDPKRKSYMFSSLDLIKVFKDKPIIWDNDYQCSCFAADREREYQDMAKKFPRAEEQMRLKIRSLKLHYEKERWRRNTMGPKNIWPLFKYLTFLEKNYEDNGETKHSSTCAFALEKKYLNEKEESPELIEPILEVVKVEVTDEADEPMTPAEEKYHPTEESPTVFTVSTVAESEINPPPPPSNPTCNPADRRSVDLFFDFLHKSFEERNISHEQFMEFADYSIKFLKTVSASKSSS